MPSNRNNRKKRTPLDLEVIKLLEEFEYNFCKYVDTAFPKKFRDSYVMQILNALSEAMKCALVGFSHDTNIFPQEKLEYISRSLGNLYYTQTCLNRLNDLYQLSDETKAILDMKLADIMDGFQRFSSSLRDKISIASQIPVSTPSGETGELEGCPTGHHE